MKKADHPKRAVVLSSGGLDSTTVMAMAGQEGFDIYSLSFDYGQKHKHELHAARTAAKTFHAKKHLVVNIDLAAIGGSSLTDPCLTVPKSHHGGRQTGRIPSTYVPARNTIFLSYALAWAEVTRSSHIFIGVNAVDYSGYPDCRPEYIRAFQTMANLATKAGVTGQRKINIVTPLIRMSKARIIQTGLALGVDYSQTRSCYDPDETGVACGCCDSCLLRKEGFKQAGVVDPIPYQNLNRQSANRS